MKALTLGTRGSDLALTQTQMVLRALQRAHPDLECHRRIIKTIGDQRQDLKLTQFSSEQILDKGIFTKELELALAAGEIDVAVHSLKDVPTELESAFVLGAFLPRADTRDVLLSKKPFGELSDLPKEACLATSSPRRRAQLQWRRPDLVVEEMRGNVPTRLSKLLQNDALDGLLLAMAGLERLGYVVDDAEDFAWEGQQIYVLPLGPPQFLPACGQGAIALEIRAGDAGTRKTLSAIDDAATRTRVTAERMILHRLQAGCHTPVGIDTRIETGDQLDIHLRVFDEDHLSTPPREARICGAYKHLDGLVDSLMDSLK